MQNEFEKQVKEKLEELKLIPSRPVWEKVEMQIRKKKERRWFIYFSLSLTLLSAGFLFLIFTSNNREASSSKTGITNPVPNSGIHPGDTFKTKTSITSGGQPGDSHKTVESKINIEEKSTDRDLITINKRGGLSNKKADRQFINGQNVGPHKNVGRSNLVFKNQESTVSVNSEKSETLLKPPSNESLVFEDTTSLEIAKNDKTVAKQQSVGQADISHVDSLKNKTEETPVSNIISDSFSKKKIQSNSKWHKTAGVELGWSQYKTGLFANAYMGQLYNSAVSSGGTSNSLYYPSEARKDFSFAVSAGLQKRFKSRIDIGMSLQFHYYSVRTMIGQLKQHDTSAYYNAAPFSISRYYTNAQQNNYTERFGIIEIPVSVGYEPFRNLSLRFSIGAAYGRLLKSNMLTFDYRSNFYYYNKDNNVKNFLSIFSALQYKIGQLNKGQITTGPIVQFNPTELQYYNPNNIPHLFFWGLKTEVNF